MAYRIFIVTGKENLSSIFHRSSKLIESLLRKVRPRSTNMGIKIDFGFEVSRLGCGVAVKSFVENGLELAWVLDAWILSSRNRELWVSFSLLVTCFYSNGDVFTLFIPSIATPFFLLSFNCSIYSQGKRLVNIKHTSSIAKVLKH